MPLDAALPAGLAALGLGIGSFVTPKRFPGKVLNPALVLTDTSGGSGTLKVTDLAGGFAAGLKPIGNKDPFSLNMGRGSVTMAYRPIAFEGRLTAKRVNHRYAISRSNSSTAYAPPRG